MDSTPVAVATSPMAALYASGVGTSCRRWSFHANSCRVVATPWATAHIASAWMWPELVTVARDCARDGELLDLRLGVAPACCASGGGGGGGGGRAMVPVASATRTMCACSATMPAQVATMMRHSARSWKAQAASPRRPVAWAHAARSFRQRPADACARLAPMPNSGYSSGASRSDVVSLARPQKRRERTTSPQSSEAT